MLYRQAGRTGGKIRITPPGDGAAEKSLLLPKYRSGVMANIYPRNDHELKDSSPMTNGRLFARTRLAFPLHQSHAMPHFYSPFLGGDAPVSGKSPMERLSGSWHGACKNIGRKQRNRQFRSHNSWLGFRFTAVNVWSESWRPRRGYTAG